MEPTTLCGTILSKPSLLLRREQERVPVSVGHPPKPRLICFLHLCPPYHSSNSLPGPGSSGAEKQKSAGRTPTQHTSAGFPFPRLQGPLQLQASVKSKKVSNLTNIPTDEGQASTSSAVNKCYGKSEPLTSPHTSRPRQKCTITHSMYYCTSFRKSTSRPDQRIRCSTIPILMINHSPRDSNKKR